MGMRNVGVGAGPEEVRYVLHRPIAAAQPRTLDVHLASMEGDLAVGFPPAVRLPLPAPRMAGTTDRLRIVIHHLAKSLQAGSQAE